MFPHSSNVGEPMSICESDLHQLSENVWTSILGPGVLVNPECGAASMKERLTGCVKITGAWEGVVLLSCSRSLVDRAAGEIFQVAREDVTSEQLQDTLKELTNITAGNVKPLLDQPAYLSLPVMPSDQERDAYVLEGQLLADVESAADGDPFRVIVLKHGVEGRDCGCVDGDE